MGRAGALSPGNFQKSQVSIQEMNSRSPRRRQVSQRQVWLSVSYNAHRTIPQQLTKIRRRQQMFNRFRSRAARWLFAGAALLAGFLFPSPNAWAQG